jgi:pimeloyl-ACP methyl ester carboxylesterase
MENRTAGKTVVFIHGLFSTPSIWTNWMEFYGEKGYTCHAPAYPFHDGNPADLRRSVDPESGKVTFGQVTASLSAYVDKLIEKPVLIGHSMGGLVVQKLIEANRGIAGICIDSAPPRGIECFKWSFLKSILPMINPLKGNSLFLPSVKWFNYTCCHTLTMQQTQLEYDNIVVPTSRNIPRSTRTIEGQIDFKKPHNPLLFIAGEIDHIIPSSLNRKNFESYTDKSSKIDFAEFKGRTHGVIGQQGWEEVARYVEKWISSLESQHL